MEWQERSGQLIREFARVYKEQVEENAGIVVNSYDPVMKWIIRWAAMALSRYSRGEDDKTAYSLP